LPTDLADIRRMLEKLGAEGRFDDLIELVVTLLVQMRDKNTALTARLGTALRQLYGRSSEKVSTEQLSLLFAQLGDAVPPDAAAAAGVAPEQGAPEAAAAAGASPQTDGSAPAPGPSGIVPPPSGPAKPLKRARGGRGPLPSHLPRERRVVSVPEAERRCANCGAEKQCIGFCVSEILDFVPAQFRVIEEQREKLACKRCPEEGVKTAPSEKVMDRGRPGPGLLANIAIEKIDDALPIYRQAARYARLGVPLSASTLGDWGAFALDVFAPVAEHIGKRVFGSSYVRADDTGLRVLDRDHPDGIKRGHMWGFVGDGLVHFFYAPDWKAKHPAELLSNFTGYLQGDGYAGYGAMHRDDGSGELIVPEDRRLGCGMHIRRYFEKLVNAGDARAAVVLGYFKGIYRVEAACKDEGLSPEERHARRQQVSIPLVDNMYRWIHEMHASAVPNTPLYKATHYALNQETPWRRCFTDGRFEIDNGEVERQHRRVAVGRKNYTFAGSDKGAERLAVGYTVFGSCRMSAVNAFDWGTDVLGKLQAGWPRSRLDELVPDVWAKRKLADASTLVITGF
jgi:transposase